MKATLLLIPTLLSVNLVAMDFQDFKQKALKNTPVLQNATLAKEVQAQKTDILQRYENPTLSLQGARFDAENLKADDAWALGVSQSIRLPSLGSDLRDLGALQEEASQATYIYAKASFSKKIEKLYSDYVYQTKLSSLIEEELALATRLENITKMRLKNGIGTKVQRMLATLEKEDIHNNLLSQKNSAKLSYFTLLSFANFNEEPRLESTFIYPFNQTFQDTNKTSPSLLKTRTQHNSALKEIDVQSHSIKSFELFGEYEQEPDIEIGRVGVAMQLPLFNAHKEEAQLAKIYAAQSALKLQTQASQQRIKIKSLKNSLTHLSTQYDTLEIQQQKQQKLLRLFEEGYKISKGSLFELIAVKNRVLAKQKRLLEIKKEANLNQIELNFIQGTYND